MLKLKKIYRLLGVSLVYTVLASSLASNVLANNQCSKASRPHCEKECESASKYSFPVCIDACLKNLCAANYGNRGSENIEGVCRACLKSQSEGYCLSSCKNTEDPNLCRKECSKLQCENQCSLLKNYSEEADPTKQDCGKCKKRVRPTCSKRCGKKTRPGYKACMVGCVHETCLTTCFPN